jgi:hypothetical protein
MPSKGLLKAWPCGGLHKGAVKGGYFCPMPLKGLLKDFKRPLKGIWKAFQKP